MNSNFNPYANLYGYNNPYMQGMMGQQVQSVHVDQVDGEQGARDFQLPPNSEKLVLDKSGQMIWLIKTDNYGMKSLVSPYDITPHRTQEMTQYEDLSARMARLEDALHEFLTPSNTTAATGAKPNEPLYATKPDSTNKANG